VALPATGVALRMLPQQRRNGRLCVERCRAAFGSAADRGRRSWGCRIRPTPRISIRARRQCCGTSQAPLPTACFACAWRSMDTGQHPIRRSVALNSLTIRRGIHTYILYH